MYLGPSPVNKAYNFKVHWAMCKNIMRQLSKFLEIYSEVTFSSQPKSDLWKLSVLVEVWHIPLKVWLVDKERKVIKGWFVVIVAMEGTMKYRRVLFLWTHCVFMISALHIEHLGALKVTSQNVWKHRTYLHGGFSPSHCCNIDFLKFICHASHFNA